HSSPQICAKLILDILGLLESGAVAEEIIRVEDAIAMELVERAVERVATAFSGNADQRARTPSVLGRIRIGRDLEFLYRVNRRSHDLRGQLLHVLGNRVVIDAVQDKVVLQRANAMDIGPTGSPVGRTAALFGKTVSLNTRNHRQEVIPVTRRERQVGD